MQSGYQFQSSRYEGDLLSYRTWPHRSSGSDSTLEYTLDAISSMAAKPRRRDARGTDRVTRREFDALRVQVERNSREHEVAFIRIAHMQTEIDALKKSRP